MWLLPTGLQDLSIVEQNYIEVENRYSFNTINWLKMNNIALGGFKYEKVDFYIVVLCVCVLSVDRV